MSLITYGQNASMSVSGLIPAGGAGISLLAAPSLSLTGLPSGDYLAETYQVRPATAATSLDLGKITTAKVLWIQTDQPLVVTLIQASFYGTSVSDVNPVTSIGGGTLTFNLNGDGVKSISMNLTGDTTGVLIAADIQAKVRALTAVNSPLQGAYDNFTAMYTNGVYTLTSGIGNVGSSVVVSNSGVAPSLKLGVANGGVETGGMPPTVLTLDNFLMSNLTFFTIQLANMSPTNVANVAVVILGTRDLSSGTGIF